MKLSIPPWRKAIAALKANFHHQNKCGSQDPSQPARLHAEVLEERWNFSSSLPAKLDKGPSNSGSQRTIASQLTLPDVIVKPKPVIDSLQALLDGPDPIVDLGGLTWVVPTRLTISTQHSGKTIQNGMIKFTFEGTIPRVGGMEIIQGRKWYNSDGDVEYFPAGNIDLTLKNLVLDGSFPHDYGLQAQTEYTADAENKGYNLVTTVTNSAHSLTLENVHVQNSGNSAFAGSFETLIGRNISANRVAKHVLGIRGFGGVYVNVDGLVVMNSGSVVDFHNDGSFFDLRHPDVAVVNNITAHNIRGRSKVAGNNWSIDGANWYFEQDDVVNLNLYPAFDLAKHPRRFVVDGFVSINFPTMGIGTLGDNRTGGEIQLSNVYICNSMAGIKIQQELTVVDSEFEGISLQFRSAAPEFQSNVAYESTQSPEDWASTFEQIDDLYETKNAEWGTQYDPRYFLPKSVQLLMD